MTAIQLCGVSKVYSGQQLALDNLTLSIPEGAFFGLLGPNGAGKSTTIGIISTLVPPSSGQVVIGGVDIQRHPAQAKVLMGMVPQEFNFMVFETCETILRTHAGYYGVSPSVATQRLKVLLDQLGLSGQEKVPAFQLSGGMKRRLMLARALMHRPRILILDEPTAGVDIQLRRIIWGLLQDLNREGVTILLTTHYLEEAEALCRQVGVIHQGRLMANEPTRELVKRLPIETVVMESDVGSLPDLAGIGFGCRWIGEGVFEVDMTRGMGITQVVTALAERGVCVHRMTQKSNRLEEVLVGLTA
ncbi:ABC transporter ATP-binding protein [bacterium]|nr:ABC transporter ATP-binding protein [bacterium]